MRNATYHAEFIRDPDKGNNVIGFHLGADYCAEHEWGISGLKDLFGLPNKSILDDWDDMVIPATSVDKIEFVECKKYFALRTNFYAYDDKIKDVIERQFSLKSLEKYSKESYDKTDFLSAWDSKNLLIVALSETAKRNLKQLYAAFSEGNVVLSQMRNSVFKNGGISLSFNDRVPRKIKDDFNASCEDAKKLKKAADDTGIKAKLDTLNQNKSFDAPHGYFALSPRWKFGEKQTKYSVMFWLNPMQQDKNNYGWYTVEELEQWMEGKGPILKK